MKWCWPLLTVQCSAWHFKNAVQYNEGQILTGSGNEVMIQLPDNFCTLHLDQHTGMLSALSTGHMLLFILRDNGQVYPGRRLSQDESDDLVPLEMVSLSDFPVEEDDFIFVALPYDHTLTFLQFGQRDFVGAILESNYFQSPQEVAQGMQIIISHNEHLSKYHAILLLMVGRGHAPAFNPISLSKVTDVGNEGASEGEGGEMDEVGEEGKDEASDDCENANDCEERDEAATSDENEGSEDREEEDGDGDAETSEEASNKNEDPEQVAEAENASDEEVESQHEGKEEGETKYLNSSNKQQDHLEVAMHRMTISETVTNDRRNRKRKKSNDCSSI